MNDLSYISRKAIRNEPGRIINRIPIPKPNVIEGQDARNRIGAICKENGFKRVMVITDRKLYSLGFHTLIADSLLNENIDFLISCEINSEPNVAIVKKIRKQALAFDADCIVALGGGSVMDISKIVVSGLKLKHFTTRGLLLKLLFVPKSTAPLITIPSTAGTGAETTVAAMVAKSAKSKGSTVIIGLNIPFVILDTALTINAPWDITAACGIDALSHGLEGCVSRLKSDDETMFKSRECVKLVLENLPKLKNNPQDITARAAMARAAFYGGNAINCQLAGYVHAFAHTIGSAYHIPHGVSIAKSLIPVFKMQMNECAEDLAALAIHCKLVPEGSNIQTAANTVMNAIESLIHYCNLKSNRKHIPDKDKIKLTRGIEKDSINYCSPKIFKKEEIIETLEEIIL